MPLRVASYTHPALLSTHFLLHGNQPTDFCVDLKSIHHCLMSHLLQSKQATSSVCRRLTLQLGLLGLLALQSSPYQATQNPRNSLGFCVRRCPQTRSPGSMWKVTPHAIGGMCYGSDASTLSVFGCLAVTTTLMCSFAISLPTVGSGRVQAVSSPLASYSRVRHD